MRTLDIGSGQYPRNPFDVEDVYGVDIAEFSEAKNVRTADLNIDPIPYPDNYFDYVTAYDFLEHVPRIIYVNGKIRNSFIEVMNEVWRVLKPGGIFLAHTPHYEHIEAFSDPTHVNFITQKTVDYFTIHAEPLGRIYGFLGTFELLSQYSHPQYNYWLVWELKAKK